MYNYKDHIKGFFKFYSDLNYLNVMSTFDGKVYEAKSYTASYKKFQLGGFNIADPLSKRTNCGYVGYRVKVKFIELCKASSCFLKSTEL